MDLLVSLGSQAIDSVEQQMAQHRTAVAVLEDRKLIQKIRDILNSDEVEFDATHSGWMTYTSLNPLNYKQLEALVTMKLDLSEDKIGRTVIRFKQHRKVYWAQYLLWFLFCLSASVTGIMFLYCVYQTFFFF